MYVAIEKKKGSKSYLDNLGSLSRKEYIAILYKVVQSQDIDRILPFAVVL